MRCLQDGLKRVDSIPEYFCEALSTRGKRPSLRMHLPIKTGGASSKNRSRFYLVAKDLIMNKIISALIAGLFAVGAFAQAPAAPVATPAPAVTAAAPAPAAKSEAKVAKKAHAKKTSTHAKKAHAKKAA